jgi:glycosyltransferase involved in cell wall biosynthesis
MSSQLEIHGLDAPIDMATPVPSSALELERATILNGSTPAVRTPVLSVVVPLLNESAVLDETVRRLREELDFIGEPYEILFVDDGSTDDSRAILTKYSLSDPRIRIVALSRNFGHEMATTAGLEQAKGQAAIIIDADLQDPPEVMREFVARWREGYKVVYGVRARREGEGPFKKVTSYLFYRLMARIGDIPIPPDTGDFRLLDRRVLDVYKQLSEDPRFFRGLVSWIGFKQIGVPFVRKPRHAGYTKYRATRLVRLAFDTITAFSSFTALIIMMTACAIGAVSALLIAGVALLSATGVIETPGWVWADLGFLVLFNIQFFCIAVLGEYLVRTHRHTQRRPLYVVDCLIEKGKSV